MKHLVNKQRKIDLRECEEGDILISQHGVILQYIRDRKYFPHEVKYLYDNKLLNLHTSRLHNGCIFKNDKLGKNHDIKRIVKKDVFKRYLRFITNKL
jgi:hypothetical protein